MRTRRSASMDGTADSRIPIVAGITVSAAGLWLMSMLEAQSAYATSALPTLVVVAAGLGIAFVPLMGLATATSRSATAVWPWA